MSGERPSNVRKNRRGDTVSQAPETVIEIAEPVTPQEDERDSEPSTRPRRLTVDEVPFDFLSAEDKEKILRERERIEEEARRKLQEDQINSKRAKALLGVFIGAGIGMYAAYLMKGRLFSPAVERVLENATEMVEQ